MRVVQVVNSTYGAAGQIGFRARRLKEYLDRWDVENYCLARAAGGDPRVRSVLPFGQALPRALNAYRIFVNPRFNNRKYDAPLFERFARPRLLEMLQRLRAPVVVHLWEYSEALIEVCRAHGARVVLEIPIAPASESRRLSLAGFPMDTPMEDRMVEREQRAMFAADLLLAPSNYVAQILVRCGIPSDRIVVNPFGADTKVSARPASTTTTGLTFLFAGTLSRRKGISYLLEAWRSGGFVGDELVLCGRVGRTARVELQACVANNVRAVGHVDLEPYWGRADVFVLPTLMEGSAKVVYEAMAHGVPVITTPNAGSVIEDGVDGLIVPIGDVSALSDAMRLLKHDVALRARLARSALEKVAGYTWERYARGVVAAYERVCA